MNNAVIENSAKRLVLELDKKFFDNFFIEDLLKRIRAIELIKKAQFEEEVLDIAEEIKQDWWDRNGKEYLKDITND